MSESDRKIDVVIDQLLQVIPEKEVNLIVCLKAYKGTLWNQSPEALKLSYNWEPVQRILMIHITSIDEPWHQSVVDIFSNKTR
jgi:hypothetical protein